MIMQPPASTLRTLLARVSQRLGLPVQVVIVLSGIALMTIFTPIPLGLTHVLVVLPIALLAPGYAIMLATFGLQPHVDAVPAFALSAILSLAAYGLLGVALYVVTIPLSMASVLIGTDLLVLLLIGATVLRTRRGMAAVAWTAASFDAATAVRTGWNGARGGIRFVAIVGVVCVALLGAQRALPKQAADPYTQFYLAGTWSHLSSIVHAQPHKKLNVEVGITNHTHQARTYRITPLLDNAPTWHARDVTVPSGRTWMGAVVGYVPATGCLHRLSISLSAKGTQALAGPLTLWLRGAPGLPASCKTGAG